MDIGTVTSLISSVGFPIACCFVCFWYIKKMNDEHRQEMEKLTIKLTEINKSETEKLSETIRNNTSVMMKLIEKIEKGGTQKWE